MTDTGPNPYQPPRAELDEELEQPTREGIADFYVIGIPKLLALQVLSLGWFSTYWFWRQWRQYALFKHKHLVAWARAFFSFLFVVQLFRAIDREGRAVGKRVQWSPTSQALLFLALLFSSVFVGDGHGVPPWAITIPLSIVMIVPIAVAQRAANVAAGDAEGKTNARITGQNVVRLLPVWIIWGSILWGSILAANYMLRSKGFPVR